MRGLMGEKKYLFAYETLRNEIHKTPRRARLGARLPAKAAARDEQDRLRIREAFVQDRRCGCPFRKYAFLF